MILSFFITMGAATYIYFAVQEKSTISTPLEKSEPVPDLKTQTPVILPAEVENIKESLPPPAESNMENKKEQIGKKSPHPTVSKKPAGKMRNISFKLFNRSATEVFIIGDFNNWNREPLTKIPDRNWETSVQLAPGTYKYLYVINGKRTKDPSNKKISADGKSLLVVKPLAK